jgi:hypothetical protein
MNADVIACSISALPLNYPGGGCGVPTAVAMPLCRRSPNVHESGMLRQVSGVLD